MKNLLLPLFVTLGMGFFGGAAPAPFPKEKPPPPRQSELLGEWSLRYDKEDFQAELKKDGDFIATWRGSRWSGRWECSGEYVTVGEWAGGTLATPSNPLRWRVKMTRHRSSRKIIHVGVCEDLPPNR